MKKSYLFLITLFVVISANAQIINFADAAFKAKLVEASPLNSIARDLNHQNVKIDANGDGEIDQTEAATISALDVRNSSVTSLDGITYFSQLTALNCTENLVTEIDISSLLLLDILQADFNPNLVYLNIKNGRIGFNIPQPPPVPAGIGQASFEQCYNLRYVCADDNKLADGQLYLSIFYSAGYVNLNTYCSLAPGGTFYTLSGTVTFDANQNGCDASDSPYPNLKLSYGIGGALATSVSDSTGNYLTYFPSGTYTVTPILYNPAYFTISPASVTVTFPNAVNPTVQNFCITANSGVHPDLDVTILPLSAARPGFNATYKIIYRNKGNQTESGVVTFGFNDAVADFVSANVPVSDQILNYLNWNFTNLLPFESREITVTLNINSPVAVPPVSSGYVLNFSAAIIGNLTDEFPQDNQFMFSQTVVNSMDPNDKTCLEGSTITSDRIGKDVHYMIRFENTGTANAQNIVVKDLLDASKFDISSLAPISASHSFVTKISNGNKVEFFFENINLPFDDAHNDGYIAFKIKTLPTLTVGDSFSNTAAIYFDYNFPIATNTATTTVSFLAQTDFAFENYCKVYPNPTKDILILETAKSIEVTSVNIYNTLGQLVLQIPLSQQTKSMDVSSLKTGSYLMQVNSNKGSSSVKFMKI